MRLVEDNARAHIHSNVINCLTEESINIMVHTAYSPDLAPCNYWVNDYMKRNLIDEANAKCFAHSVSKLVKNTPEEEFLRNFGKRWNFI